MKNLSKLILFLFITVSLFAINYSLYTLKINAQVPQLKMPCSDTGDPEFNSLRPYQAAPCDGGPLAYMCSNDLIFIESFKVNGEGDCVKQGAVGNFTCNPNHIVKPHTLYVELDNAKLPILGNTEQVKNSQNPNDQLNDAQKMNEYASWYLNGVINRAEYGDTKNTDTELVNFSGPINKLLPSQILEAQRIETIENATTEIKFTDPDSEEDITSTANHNQIVACANKDGLFGILGKSVPTECYTEKNKPAQGTEVFRLKTQDGNEGWDGDLSELRGFINQFNLWAPDAWNKRIPPLPWADKDGKPFESDILYRKAYNEWQGKSCAILPIVGLVCIDNPLVANKWANLYPYIPLANTTDNKGNEFIFSVQPKPSNGTGIEEGSWSYGDIRNAPLYFSHTEEDSILVNTLNQTYNPQGLESTAVPDTTEPLECTALKARSNSGDDLFPGDPDEMQVPDITYKINQAKCEEKAVPCNPNNPDHDPDEFCTRLSCYAEVIITLKTETKTPYVQQIWENAVANSNSTFRKMFPKVQESAPVSCIANMPGVTSVEYDASKSNGPTGGDVTFKVKNVPEDGSSTSPQLTFPYIGSVYEYFLKGIQTALRPKGYGDPIPNGLYCKTEEEVEDMCPVVEDSKVPEKWLGAYKQTYIDRANNWTDICTGPENNLGDECYNYVVSESLKRGVNPAFSLTMWLEESSVSNYCKLGETAQDFGINIEAYFQNIVKQLEIFLNMATEKKCDGVTGFYEPMNGWLSRYQSLDGICDPKDQCGTTYTYGGTCNWAGQDKTFGGWINIWEIVAGGCTTSGTTPIGKKFSIDWPTDMNCP